MVDLLPQDLVSGEFEHIEATKGENWTILDSMLGNPFKRGLGSPLSKFAFFFITLVANYST